MDKRPLHAAVILAGSVLVAAGCATAPRQNRPGFVGMTEAEVRSEWGPPAVIREQSGHKISLAAESEHLHTAASQHDSLYYVKRKRVVELESGRVVRVRTLNGNDRHDIDGLVDSTREDQRVRDGDEK